MNTLEELQVWGESRHRADIAVLAVHGRTQSPADMQTIAERIGQIGARYYAPTAPGNSWYPQPFLVPLAENQPALTHALASLTRSLAAIEAEGFDRDHIVLLGFSQGACLLSQFLINTHPHVAGAVLFTGGYVGEQLIDTDLGRDMSLAAIPILMRSIENDPWVPQNRVLETAQLFEHLGATVDVRIDPGTEHIITDEAIERANGFLLELAKLAGRS